MRWFYCIRPYSALRVKGDVYRLCFVFAHLYFHSNTRQEVKSLLSFEDGCHSAFHSSIVWSRCLCRTYSRNYYSSLGSIINSPSSSRCLRFIRYQVLRSRTKKSRGRTPAITHNKTSLETIRYALAIPNSAGLCTDLSHCLGLTSQTGWIKIAWFQPQDSSHLASSGLHLFNSLPPSSSNLSFYFYR